jgi:molybdenum cofactor synthesis domain-containing protein
MTDDSPPSEEHHHPMVPVPDALRTVLYQTAKVLLHQQQQQPPAECVINVNSPWQQLLGKTVASDVIMPAPGYPPYQASIMDGYAIQSKIITANATSSGTNTAVTRFTVVDKVHAGDGAKTSTWLGSSERDGLPVAVYVTTGAVIPQGLDCVIPMEDIRKTDNDTIEVSATATIQTGAWIRKVGCDMEEGMVVVPAGYVLDPVGLGLIKQSGVESVHVRKPLQVGVLSTGNELIRHSEDGNQVGRIPDVNRPILLSLVSTFGTCTPVDLGIERDDDVESLTNTILAAFDTCDVIITTGGISMGEADIVEQVLVERLGGTLHFGRMHMKPGKPTTFVTLAHKGTTKLIFAMPGNPVSATVCTQLLVRPCLDLLFNGASVCADTHGESTDDLLYRIVSNAWVHAELRATLTHSVKLDKERPEYHRVTLQQSQHGTFEATSTGIQQSSRLQSLRGAQGLLLLPQGGTKMTADAGEEFTVLMLHDAQQRLQVCNSAHLRKPAQKSPFRIAVVHVVSPTNGVKAFLEQVASRVRVALSGTKSGPAEIVSSHTFAGEPDSLISFCSTRKENTDVICIVCQDYPGSFLRNLDISNCLRTHLDKVADAMALQARRGAASADAPAALFETVVGFLPPSSMVICVSEQGMEGALQNVRGLLKHALKVAKGKGAE